MSLFKHSSLAYTVLFIYTVISIISIEKYQLPWVDDVGYSDITLNLLAGKGFICNAVTEYKGKGEILFYGPVYFFINALIVKIFGIGIWQFRILNMLSGLILIILIWKTLIKYCNENTGLIFILLVISDRTFNFSLHSGRMDLFAALLLFAAIKVFEKTKEVNFIRSMLVGLLISLACLTTLRIILFLPLLAILPFTVKEQTEKIFLIKSLGIILLTIGIIYSGWIFYAFGSINKMIIYFQSFQGHINKHFANDFTSEIIFNRLFRKIYEVPKFVLFYVSIYLYFRHKSKYLISNIFILIVLSFLLFVDEVGPYRAMIFPVLYFIILTVMYNEYKKNIIIHTFYSFSLSIILLVNTILLSVRVIIVYDNWTDLNFSQLEKKLIQEIPKDSKIIGDIKYYFSCKKSGYQFEVMGTLPDNEIKAIGNQYILSSEKLKISSGNSIELIPKREQKLYPSIIEKIKNSEGQLKNMSINCYLYKPI